MPYRVSYSR